MCAASVATGAPSRVGVVEVVDPQRLLAQQAQVDRRHAPVDAAADLGGDHGTGEPLRQRLVHAPPPVRGHLGAAATHGELAGVGPDHGHAADARRIQRQHAVVDQQDGPLRRHPAGHRPPPRIVVLLLVGDRSTRPRIPTRPISRRTWRTWPSTTDSSTSPVAHGGGQRGTEPGRRARHLEVEPGQRRRHGGVRPEPVGHDQPVEAPLAPQHAVDQVRLLAAVDAVDLVVGGHHGPDAGLLYGVFEGDEVDLPQGPLVDLGADRHPLVLLVVAGEVLDAAGDPAPLHALDVGAGDAGRQQAGPRRRTRRSARRAACARCTPSDRAARARSWSGPRRPGRHRVGGRGRGSRSTRRRCRRGPTGSAGRSGCRPGRPTGRRTP